MSVVVAYKYAPNPQDATVSETGEIDWSRAHSSVCESDPVAIELGRRLADDSAAELVGISVGLAEAGSAKARKSAMARGFDRGVVVADDAVADWNSTRVARVLAQLVARENADLVITGAASVDDSAGVIPALIAGFLEWPCFLEVKSVEKTDTGYRIEQQAPGGNRTIEIHGNAVLAATSDAIMPRVAGMKEILAAGKKPVEVLDIAGFELGAATATVTGYQKPPVRDRKHQIFKGPDAAAQLVAALRADGIW
ncbi:MAG: electron transfer flavoprotein beta subunit/FixA family protein [Trueperella sp.]|nr:electron transfer flavoprotein beta subunit/FixA family protein [Trueperella sp.]